MEAHEASSLYSEEQAKLLRTVGTEIEEASSNLAVFMSALQLDDIPRSDFKVLPFIQNGGFVRHFKLSLRSFYPISNNIFIYPF